MFGGRPMIDAVTRARMTAGAQFIRLDGIDARPLGAGHSLRLAADGPDLLSADQVKTAFDLSTVALLAVIDLAPAADLNRKAALGKVALFRHDAENFGRLDDLPYPVPATWAADYGQRRIGDLELMTSNGVVAHAAMSADARPLAAVYAGLSEAFTTAAYVDAYERMTARLGYRQRAVGALWLGRHNRLARLSVTDNDVQVRPLRQAIADQVGVSYEAGSAVISNNTDQPITVTTA